MREPNPDLESLPLTHLEKPLGGRYKIVQQLRIGGFSQTFVAEDLHLPDCPLCVIKQLKPYFETDQDLQTARRLFDTEAKVLYSLGNHDQIPRLLAHFEENQNFYLAQELIEGEPLDQLLVDHQTWTEAEVVSLLRDTLNVLVFVHQQGVIHRDIKPSNLIRRQSDGKIVLIDFGAVKQVSLGIAQKMGQTDLTVSVGTQGYTANEQLAGEPRFSSDLYAIGMVAIQAITGVRPKNLKKDPRTLEFRWYQKKAAICQELATLLSRMTRYDFRERYTTASEPLEVLQALLTSPNDLPKSLTKVKSNMPPDALLPGINGFKAENSYRRPSHRLSSDDLLMLPGINNLKAAHPHKQPLSLPSSEKATQQQFPYDDALQSRRPLQLPSASLSNESDLEILSPEFRTALVLFLKRLFSIRGVLAIGFTILIANLLLPARTNFSPLNQRLASPSPTSTPTQGQEDSQPLQLESSSKPPNADPAADNPANADSVNPNSFGEISNVPSGLFNYGGSTTWAIIRSEVDPILQASHPEFQLRQTHPVHGTAGSGTGIRMLLDGQMAFSQSSRPLEDQEYQQALRQGFSLKQVPVALEGVAIAVHPSLSIPGLNLDQLKDIYIGKITNWQQVGGPNRKITPYSRPAADSGTVEFFVKNVLNGNDLGMNVQSVDSTTTGLQKLANNPGGIYYASAPEVIAQCSVKALPIAAESTNFVSPYKDSPVAPADCFRQKNQLNHEAFKSGQYPITRQLFVIIKQDGQIDQQAGEAYARLLMTNEGQELLAKEGFVRIR